MLGQYVYRCCRFDEWDQNTLQARGRSGTLVQGVAFGSRRNSPSSYIHASTRLEVAEWYWRNSHDPDPWIARIDINLLDHRRIFDLSTPRGRQRWLGGRSRSAHRARSFAEKDSEVVLQAPVPMQAIEHAVYDGSKVLHWEKLGGDAETPQVEAYRETCRPPTSLIDCLSPDMAGQRVTATQGSTQIVGTGCFPSDANVMLKTCKMVKMSSLKIGDVVLTRSHPSLSTIWSEVYAFGHRDSSAVASYQVLEVSSGRSVSLSSDHLIWVVDKGFIPAGSVMVGDSLLEGRDDVAQLTQVTSVKAQILRGVIAPFTFEGTILVDNVMVSCYACLRHQWLFHICMAPIRGLYRWCWIAVAAGHWHGGFFLRGAHIFVDLMSFFAPLVRYLDM